MFPRYFEVRIPTEATSYTIRTEYSAIFSPPLRNSPWWAKFSSLSRLHYHPQDTQYSVRLLWKSDQPDAYTPTWHTRDRHPCPRRDSNPQSQLASGQRESFAVPLRNVQNVYWKCVLWNARWQFINHGIRYYKTLLGQRISPCQRLLSSLLHESSVVCLLVARWRNIWRTSYHPSSPTTQEDLPIIQADNMAIVEGSYFIQSYCDYYWNITRNAKYPVKKCLCVYKPWCICERNVRCVWNCTFIAVVWKCVEVVASNSTTVHVIHYS